MGSLYVEVVREDDTGRFHTSFRHALPSTGDTMYFDDRTWVVQRAHWTLRGRQWEPTTVVVRPRDE